GPEHRGAAAARLGGLRGGSVDAAGWVGCGWVASPRQATLARDGAMHAEQYESLRIPCQQYGAFPRGEVIARQRLVGIAQAPAPKLVVRMRLLQHLEHYL